jgi:MinD-like ATPase involved in chromosome partitioning or flagellar assembly
LVRTIAIASGKGGVGKTTLATNLAVALNELGYRVIVIDANLTTPHLSYYLGLPEYSVTLNDILRGKEDIRYAVTSHNGVMFVPASLNPSDIIGVDIKDLKDSIKRLDLPMIDFVFVDCAPGLGREAVCGMEACDEIIFVTTPTIPNMMDVKRTMDMIDLRGKKLWLVLNMVGLGKYEFKRNQVEELLGLPVIGEVPFDKNVIDSVAFGVPLFKFKPKSPACIGYMQIACQLVGKEFEVYPTLFQKILATLKEKIFGKR